MALVASVKQSLLPQGYEIHMTGEGKARGQWIVLYYGSRVSRHGTRAGLYDSRDDAIRAAWKHAGKSYRKQLAGAPYEGWGKIGTAETIRSEWRGQIGKLRRERQSPSKTAGQVTRLANLVNAMLRK